MPKCAIFLAEGFEDCEAMITIDVLRRARIQIDTVSITDEKRVVSSHNVPVESDKVFNEIQPDDYDVLILPGGRKGTEHLEAFEPLKKSLVKHFNDGKLTCAICAAPSILGHLGLLKGRNYTCFPEFDADYGGHYEQELSVVDGNLITGRGMGATMEFARNIAEQYCSDVQMDHLDYGMQYEHRFRDLKKPA